MPPVVTSNHGKADSHAECALTRSVSLRIASEVLPPTPRSHTRGEEWEWVEVGGGIQ